MTALVWDQEDEKLYETGIDRGVLYHLDGRAVVWNGLLSVSEKVGVKSESSYFGGEKVQDRVHPGNYEAEVQAITYPDILDEYGVHAAGAVLGEQIPSVFSFTYREQVSDGSHNIHIVGNATFISGGISYRTIGGTTTATTFSWAVMAPRTIVQGLPMLAHVIVNTEKANPLFVEWLEEQLYGSDSEDATMPSFQDFMDALVDFTIIKITDNGDGTWTAHSDFPGYISTPVADQFQIDDGDVTWVSPGVHYEIGDL